jgi:hypothetical protein
MQGGSRNATTSAFTQLLGCDTALQRLELFAGLQPRLFQGGAFPIDPHLFPQQAV